MAEHRSDLDYGLDADLKAKEAAKYDPALEKMATGFLEDLAGESSGGQPLLKWLKDGKVLCKAMNKVKPGAIPKVNDSTMPFKQMENIANFLQACRKELGMKENDLFTTPDVYDERSVVNTINGLINFSRAATKGGFSGPSIAPKEAEKSSTGKKWEIGTGGDVSKMNMGSLGIMERAHLDTTHDINFGNKAAGTGTSGDATKLSMGSSGVMERTEVSKSNDINFGNKSAGTGSGDVSMMSKGSSEVMERTQVSHANNIDFGAKSAKKP